MPVSTGSTVQPAATRTTRLSSAAVSSAYTPPSADTVRPSTATTPVSVANTDTGPAGPIDTMRPVFRSATRAVPSGRNAIADTVSSPVATVVTAGSGTASGGAPVMSCPAPERLYSGALGDGPRSRRSHSTETATATSSND